MDAFSFHQTILIIASQILIYFPLGYLTIGIRIKHQPTIIKWLISILFGLLIFTIVLSIIGIFYIGYLSTILVAIFGYVILLFVVYKKVKFHELRAKISKIRLTNHNVLIAIIAVVAVLMFSNIATFLQWAPGVDSINHGMLTNLLINNGRMSTNLTPIAPTEPWFEPFGFHVNSANLSLITGLYPGQSILVFSTIVTSLTVISCFVIVYYNTKSIALSLLAMISCFLIFSNINDARFLEKWFLGFYYNTPYANLFGFFFLILFSFVYFAMNDLKSSHNKTYNFMLVSTLLGIAVSYTPFLVLPLAYLIIKRISKIIRYLIPLEHIIQKTRLGFAATNSRVLSKIIHIFIILFLVATVIICVNYIIDNAHDPNNNFLTLLNRIKNNSYYYSTVVLNPSSFVGLIGYWIIFLLVMSVISILRNNRMSISYFYLFISSILTVSSFVPQVINEEIWFLLGGRLFVFMILLSEIVGSLYLHDIIKWFLYTRSLRQRSIDLKALENYFQIIVVFIVVTCVLVPSFISNISLEQASYWGWQVISSEFQNDYNLFNWVHENVNESDRILTDYTYTSKRLLSFSLSNVTALPIPISPTEVEMAKETVIVWDKPTLLKSFVDKYDVKYVILDSDFNRRIPAELGGNEENLPRTYNSTEYNIIFSNMPFLNKMKEYGSSAIYSVIK